MLLFFATTQKVWIPVSAAVDSVSVWNYTLLGENPLSGTFDDATDPGACIVELDGTDTNGAGPTAIICRDVGGNVVGVLNAFVTGGVPAAINDVSAVNALVQPAALRAALGLALANLDTQLANIGSISPAAIRAALGLALANLDTQLANILGTQSGPVTLSNTGVQQVVTAVGVGVPSVPVPFVPSTFPAHNDG